MYNKHTCKSYAVKLVKVQGLEVTYNSFHTWYAKTAERSPMDAGDDSQSFPSLPLVVFPSGSTLLLEKFVTDSITVKSMASLLEQNTEGYT
jgi:hypothetical protein